MGATTFCAAANTVLFVAFNDAAGDVPPATASAAAVAVSTDPSVGALSGIFPMWGTFTLAINGETTAPIAVSASADDVATALKALYSLRDVAVSRDVYGVPFMPDLTTVIHPAFTQPSLSSSMLTAPPSPQH
jgi:hypothetical protein